MAGSNPPLNDAGDFMSELSLPLFDNHQKETATKRWPFSCFEEEVSESGAVATDH